MKDYQNSVSDWSRRLGYYGYCGMACWNYGGKSCDFSLIFGLFCDIRIYDNVHDDDDDYHDCMNTDFDGMPISHKSSCSQIFSKNKDLTQPNYLCDIEELYKCILL